MGLWIYMLVMTLLIPLSMLGFGYRFFKKAPTNINVLLGYRTARSMKNRETWEFAHRYFGKRCMIWGASLVPVAASIMMATLGKNEDVIGNVGAAICLGALIPLLGCVVVTERALRRQFRASDES